MAARRGHPAIAGPLDIATVRGLSYVVLVPEPREVYAANKLWALPAIIERTDLVGILPRWFHREIAVNFAIDAHELPVKLPEQHCAMLWHVRNKSDAGHRWLRDSLMEAFRARG